MTRPMRGVPFTEAVLKWGDPEVLARLAGKSGISSRGRNGNRRSAELYRQADLSLLERLYDRELFASGLLTPGSNRHIIDPESLNPSRAEYSRTKSILLSRGAGTEFYDVEVFTLHAVPLNILSKPQWFQRIEAHAGSDATSGQATDSPEPLQPGDRFRHAPDYRHVVLDGLEYSLTATQALIVRVLHRAMDDEAGPWLHVEHIREQVGFESDKLAHLFRRLPDWQILIRSDRRGYYRLNL